MSFSRRYSRRDTNYKETCFFESAVDTAAGFDCTVAVVDDQVRICFDSTDFTVSLEVAWEISECVIDAFNVTLFGYEDPWNERESYVLAFDRYREGSAYRSLIAEGNVPISNASSVFFGDKAGSGITHIKIQGMLDGHYQVKFGPTSYSFALEYAVWLCFSLRDACQHIEQSPPEC
jgi:hypothetical protein